MCIGIWVFVWLVFHYLMGNLLPPMSRIDYDSAKSYADLLSISVALARCTPLSTKLDRPLYRDLVILDDPFCMQFLPYLMVLLMCPTHTLTAQQWLPMAM